MVDAVAALFPNAGVGHIGLYRNEETLEPVSYYFKIPPLGADKVYLVLDPMLATGGSASAAITKLKESGAKQLRLISLVAAPAGVERMKRDHPDVPVFVAALDRELNEHGYILPGLGDAGDRLLRNDLTRRPPSHIMERGQGVRWNPAGWLKRELATSFPRSTAGRSRNLRTGPPLSRG